MFKQFCQHHSWSICLYGAQNKMRLVVSWVGTTPPQGRDAIHLRQAGRQAEEWSWWWVSGGSSMKTPTRGITQQPELFSSVSITQPGDLCQPSMFTDTGFKTAGEGRRGGKGCCRRLSRKQPLGDRRLAIQSFEEPRYFPHRLDYLLSEDDDALLLGFLMFLLVQVNDPSNPYTFRVATVKYQGSDFQNWNRLIGEDTGKFGNGAS